MEKNKLGTKLKEAIDHYGSLQKVTEHLEVKKESLEKDIKNREEKIQQSKQKKFKLNKQINRVKKKYLLETKKLESIAAATGKVERQYNLFQGFVAMLVGSPSVSTSLKNLIDLFQELINPGWALTKTHEEMRNLFVSKVMGDHLKNFRCNGCGNKFITNMEPKGGLYSGFYICPSCHNPYQVEPDDSFLKAMVSEKQLVDIITAGELKKENDILKPLKPFLDVTCDVCGKPITEWDNHNVKIARERALWGHTDCWNSGPGQFLLLMKHMKILNEGG
jgi:predicted RNA-binding Zn-ribbon protein involved in translation (DUF1610 family)